MWVVLAACGGHGIRSQSARVEVGRPGASLGGVAGDRARLYAGLRLENGQSRILASPGWEIGVPGAVGPLAPAAGLLGVTVVGGGDLRGEPGSRVLALDAATGAERWRVTVDATEWALVTSIAPVADGGFIIGGSFAGTLRIAAATVTSAGKSDGFVARLSSTGAPAWLVRFGGPHADAVAAVAARGERVALTGTFATGAELGGEVLTAVADDTPRTDLVVAELAAATGRRVWARSFGGPLDDSAAGVAFDGRGRLAVAATFREHLRVDAADLSAQGPADGLVVWFSADGTAGPVVPLGRPAFDGARAIAGLADGIVVGGFDVDRAYLVSIRDRTAEPAAVPPDRAELTALASVPGGYVAGFSHPAGITLIRR